MSEQRKSKDFWIKFVTDAKDNVIETLVYMVKPEVSFDYHVREVIPGIANSEALDLMNQKLDRVQQALERAKAAMKKECDNFRFPDEDRPILFNALEEIEAIEKGEK